MSEKKTYISAAGFIQFDPQDREANGKTVTDLVIKQIGGEAKQIRITVWPEIELGEVKLKKGDFVAVDGGFSSNTYQDKNGEQQTSLQISAFSLALLGSAFPRADREVVTSSAAPSGQSSTVPF